MAYKLLDQNGNYMEINGMHKGTILSPYVYNGMELYNENAVASNRRPFYSTFRAYRRVRIGSSYYAPSGTNKKYVDEAYSATEIAINGRYKNSSYKNYEVYKDGNLVASGSFTNSLVDIYVCQKNANTSIIVSGIWDETNSKFIYNITTNATINRQNTYKWDNSESITLDFYQCNAGYLGSNRPITSITDTKVTFYSDPNIATKIKNYYGCDEVIINSITDQFYVYNNNGNSSYYFNIYDDNGNKLTDSPTIVSNGSVKVQVNRPSGASYYTGKYGSSSTSTDTNFSSSYVRFDANYANIFIGNQTIYNVTIKYYPKKPVMKQFTFVSQGRMYCDGFLPTTDNTTVSSPSDKLTWCDYHIRGTAYIYLNNTLIHKITADYDKAYQYTIDVSGYTSIQCTASYGEYKITAS